MSNSAIWRRRLRVELKKLRTRAGMTQRDVAVALDWSPSKVIRIENGSVGVATTDLRALLAHFGLDDPAIASELEEMAKGSKKQPFVDYRDVLTSDTIRFLGYEASASTIRQVQPLVVPGLLQTEEYTRALLQSYRLDDDSIDRIVESRRERQELLESPDGPNYTVIIDESILRRTVGGSSTMRRQLQRIAEMSSKHSVTVQVIPFSAGATEALRGGFVHLEFDDESDSAVFLENATGASSFIDNPEVTGPYQETFLHLEDIASSPTSLSENIADAISELEDHESREPAEDPDGSRQ